MASTPTFITRSRKHRDTHWLRHSVTLSVAAVSFAFLLISIPIGLRWDAAIQMDPALDVKYGDIVAICALLATIVITVFSILPKLDSIARSSRFTHYAELDAMYFEILRLAFDHPYLRNLSEGWETLKGKERRKYEIYAFMVWNFIETIHDRCVDDDELKTTWAPIMIAECRIHNGWFDNQTKPDGAPFCGQFREFFRDHLKNKTVDSLMKTPWEYK